MKIELQKELYNRHSKLLNKSRYKNKYKNYAYFISGIECNDGWFNLLDDFFTEFKNCCLELKVLPLILQVKEKFGMLRVYFTYTGLEEIDEKLDEIVQKYINRSMHTCEYCSTFGEIDTIKGYMTCVCPQCKDRLLVQQKENKNEF